LVGWLVGKFVGYLFKVAVSAAKGMYCRMGWG